MKATGSRVGRGMTYGLGIAKEPKTTAVIPWEKVRPPHTIRRNFIAQSSAKLYRIGHDDNRTENRLDGSGKVGMEKTSLRAKCKPERIRLSLEGTVA